MTELVQAKMKREFWIFWSTFSKESLSMRNLRKRVKGKSVIGLDLHDKWGRENGIGHIAFSFMCIPALQKPAISGFYLLDTTLQCAIVYVSAARGPIRGSLNCLYKPGLTAGEKPPKTLRFRNKKGNKEALRKHFAGLCITPGRAKMSLSIPLLLSPYARVCVQGTMQAVCV